MKFVDPKNDVAFKRIFGDDQHQAVLISFLNAVLNLSGAKEITTVEILNPLEMHAMLKDEMSLETILKYTGLTAADLSDSVAVE